MTEQEGVIKYHLEHTDKPLPPTIDFSDLNSWRSIMIKLELIGQDPLRYDGLGFGNISQRFKSNNSSFLISGTQTGQLDPLAQQDFCIVKTSDPEKNKIISEGPSKPSSEALTHASIYLKRPDIMAIIHAHCPTIWKNTLEMKLPFTEHDISYGTPEMALAVTKVCQEPQFNCGGVFSMLGHEDGIVSFAPTMRQAANHLILALANALKIEQKKFLL